MGARSTPRVDGEVVTLKELQAEAERRLSLHAQHTALALLSPRRQREALDALLPEGLLAAYQEAYARREALLKEKAALEESLKARAEREDLLRYQIREIEEARVRPGEEEELLALAERLRHLETIRERLARALALLTEREAQDLLALAAKEVRAAARHDPALGPWPRSFRGRPRRSGPWPGSWRTTWRAWTWTPRSWTGWRPASASWSA